MVGYWCSSRRYAAQRKCTFTVLLLKADFINVQRVTGEGLVVELVTSKKTFKNLQLLAELRYQQLLVSAELTSLYPEKGCHPSDEM